MTPPGKSDIGGAYRRASADLDQIDDDRQAAVVEMIKQIADVESVVIAEDDETRYLVAAGAHNAGFRIAIVVSAAGSIGWTLV